MRTGRLSPALIAGAILLLVSAAPCRAQQGVVLPIDLPAAAGPSRIVYGIFAHPDPAGGTARPAVVVLPDDGGPDGRSAAVASALLAAGFATLELDTSADETSPDAAPAHARDLARDLPAVLGALARHPQVQPERIAAVGLGVGGRAALHARVAPDAGPDAGRFFAHAALYPGCRTLVDENLRTGVAAHPPALLLAAGADAADAGSACTPLASGTGMVVHVYANGTYAWDAAALSGVSPMTSMPLPGRRRAPVRADPTIAADALDRLVTFLSAALRQ